MPSNLEDEKTVTLISTPQTISEVVCLGRFGRILNNAVVLPTLHVRNNNGVLGFCLTPQDGNSLLTSIVATVRFLHPEAHAEILRSLDSLPFKEI